MIFLVEYDRAQGRTVRFQQFNDSDREKAQKVRLELELELNRADIAHEVVLLEAASEAALRETHSRYFLTLSEMLDSFKASTSAFVVRERKD